MIGSAPKFFALVRGDKVVEAPIFDLKYAKDLCGRRNNQAVADAKAARSPLPDLAYHIIEYTPLRKVE